MSLGYGIIEITPSKTYANEANALKAVEKRFGKPGQGNRREFNVTIMYTKDGRCYPLLCNIDQNLIGVLCHAGFNLVN